MIISVIDKIKILLSVYSKIQSLPNLRQMLITFVNPIDNVRYTEFSYLTKFLKRYNINIRTNNILDVSSPFILSYVLSSKSKIIKTDINIGEKRFIKEKDNLNFKREDATSLSFKANTFDIVYSISVIEHIYEKYIQAVEEMIRVLKPGGYLYLTFPVSSSHIEEWIDTDVYSHQYKKNNKVFYQYRFSECDVNNILHNLKNIEVLDKSIYWEKKDGQYDNLMGNLSKKRRNTKLSTIRNAFLNLWAGFTLLENRPADFTYSKSFGNMSLMLRKVMHKEVI